MTRGSRRKPGIKARALAAVGAGVLGTVLLIATGCCKPAEAAPVVLTFTGKVVAGIGTQWANAGDPITFKVFADNGGTSLISQTWDVTDILSAKITAGSYSGTTSGPIDLPNSHGSFATDATGHLASLFIEGAQNGTDSNALTDKFFYFMNGFNNVIWGIPGAAFGSDVAPVPSNTSIALAPTPIPAALPLFAVALGGLGFVGWRRRRAATVR